jgi:hypothetical protein
MVGGKITVEDVFQKLFNFSKSKFPSARYCITGNNEQKFKEALMKGGLN